MSAFHLLCIALYFVSSLCVNGYKNRNVKKGNDEILDTSSAVPFLNGSDEQAFEQPCASTSAQSAGDVPESKVEEVDEMEEKSGQSPINQSDTNLMCVTDTEDELDDANPSVNSGSGTQYGLRNRNLPCRGYNHGNTMPPSPYNNSSQDDINNEVYEMVRNRNLPYRMYNHDNTMPRSPYNNILCTNCRVSRMESSACRQETDLDTVDYRSLTIRLCCYCYALFFIAMLSGIVVAVLRSFLFYANN
ncbi:hypothetical protein VCUG_00667 [Vavraia culicis subsp. floridensis]|uniref:Uncharacterized protein n=1 Tax=Vavraia culicis (isolate floridensis) TaxID=948595 RepID=L2GXJ1_VAVCU|nr:uncharacterized protein VCUG_00667 [Vavraia culicis subsp. floridensis]ELA47825.1 hypothetical protein VCUG_00667 [Vavraia culicis subsp. floridensis]